MRESNGKEILLWLVRKRRRYRVKGDSMLPFLSADDEVLVNLNAYRLWYALRHLPPITSSILFGCSFL